MASQSLQILLIVGAVFFAGSGGIIVLMGGDFPLLLGLGGLGCLVGFAILSFKPAEKEYTGIVIKEDEKKKKLKKSEKPDVELIKEVPKKPKGKPRREREALRKAKEEAAAAVVEAAATEAAATEAAGKKKKKKGKKKKEEAEGSTEPAVEKKEEDQGWEVAEDKYKLRAAAKAAKVASGETQEGEEMALNRKYYRSLRQVREKIEGHCNVTIGIPERQEESQRQGTAKNSVQAKEQGVYIQGTTKNIAQAKTIIREIMDKGYSETMSGKEGVEKSIEVEDVKVGALVGKQGVIINALKKETNCEITVPKDDAIIKKVRVYGSPQNVAKCIGAISELIEKGFSAVTHPNYTQSTLIVESRIFFLIIGPGGSTIKDLQGRHKDVRFIVKSPPKKDEDKEAATSVKKEGVKNEDKEGKEASKQEKRVPAEPGSFTLTGDADLVAAATSDLQDLRNSIVTHELNFPRKFRYVLFQNAPNNPLREIEHANRVRITIEDHVWDPNQQTLSIIGFPSDVAAAAKALHELLATFHWEVVDFPESRVGQLVGKSGETIKKLQKKYDVFIKLDNHDWDPLVKDVTIEGRRDNVLAAKEAIESLRRVSEPAAKEPEPSVDVEQEEVPDGAHEYIPP